MSLSNNFPTVSPTLNLNFAAAGRLDSRVTFTRSSTATYVNQIGLIQSAAVNEPRFDYDPSTLAARGLLIEEQRTNSALYSDDFNSYWTKSLATVTSNAATAPDGVTSADLIVPTSTSAQPKGVYQLVTGSASGTKYTLSIFAKASGKNFVMLGSDNTIGYLGWFNLSTGSVATMASGYSGSIQSMGNGWYRCAITWDGAQGRDYPYFGPADADASAVTTINGSDGILIWGAQFESGAAFSTSYIPTVAASVTRSADVASVNTLSPWYNATEGTLFAEYSFYGADPFFNNTPVMINDGTENNYIAIFGYSSAYGWVQASGATSAGLTVGGTTAINTTYKAAVAYKTDDFAFSLSGISPATDSSGSVPTVTSMLLGRRVASSASLQGHIRRITYYPARLTNAQLQALTL